MAMSSNQDHVESILWRGFAFPGHEACRVFAKDSFWHLEGTALFSHEQRPCRLDYQIVCDSAWRTLSATVEGWLGETVVGIQIRVEPTHRWWMNEVEQPAGRNNLQFQPGGLPSMYRILPIRMISSSQTFLVANRSAKTWMLLPQVFLWWDPSRPAMGMRAISF